MRRDEWYFFISRTNFGGPSGAQAERRPYSSCFSHLHQTERSWLGPHGSTQSTCRGTRDLIVRRRSRRRRTRRRRSARRKNRPQAKLCASLPRSTRALCGSRRRSESERVSTGCPTGLRRQHIEDGETRPLHGAPFGLISGAVIISQSIYDFLIGDPNIILFVFSC